MITLPLKSDFKRGDLKSTFKRGIVESSFKTGKLKSNFKKGDANAFARGNRVCDKCIDPALMCSLGSMPYKAKGYVG